MDVVILDLIMPVLSGYETFKLIRAVHPGFPVILSSGYSEQAALTEFGEESPFAFIQQLFRHNSLSEKLRFLLSDGSNGQVAGVSWKSS